MNDWIMKWLCALIGMLTLAIRFVATQTMLLFGIKHSPNEQKKNSRHFLLTQQFNLLSNLFDIIRLCCRILHSYFCIVIIRFEFNVDRFVVAHESCIMMSIVEIRRINEEWYTPFAHFEGREHTRYFGYENITHFESGLQMNGKYVSIRLWQWYDNTLW